MSYTLNPLKTVKVLDPLVNINEEREYAILEGGKEYTWKPVISTSYSNSNAVFSAPPPNPGIIVDRKVIYKQPVTLTFTGTSSGHLLNSGYDAFRAYPISSILNVLNVTLNNTSASINMSDVIQPLLRYHNCTMNKEYDYSLTPSYMDQSQNYTDLIGGNRNPLGTYLDGTDGDVMQRGAFKLDSISNGATGATLTATLTEPLFLSPFLFSHHQHSGFIGLQTMQFTFNWNSDLTRIWSHASGQSTLSSITVTLGQPTLLFKYITPKETMRIPRFCQYPYFVVDRYPTQSSNSYAPNASNTESTANIQLNSIPRRMYILARKNNSSLTYADSDVFFGIQKISINWNNRSGLLSSASQEQLYKISVKNGCNLNWTQWSGGPSTVLGGNQIGTIGSVLCLEFGTDIGLTDLEAPGLNGTYQLQMDLTIQNVNQTQTIANPVIYVITVSEGVLSIEDNRVITQIGVISKQDILDAQQQKGIDYKTVEHVSGSGDFLGDVKQFFKELPGHVVQGIKYAAPAVKEIASTARELAPLLLGVGDGGVAVGGKKACKKCLGGGCDMCAGVMVGGKMMSRSKLKKRQYM